MSNELAQFIKQYPQRARKRLSLGDLRQIDGLYRDRIAELEQQLEELRERMAQINQWCEAYPSDIFPEPTSEDWKALNKLCKEHLGHGIDRYSASNMRHVVTGIAKYALPPSKC